RQPSLALHVLGTIAACLCCLVLVGYSAFLGYALYSARNQMQLQAEAGHGPGGRAKKAEELAQLLEKPPQPKKGNRSAPAPSAAVRTSTDSATDAPGEIHPDDIDHAGGDIKLVKLDLSPAGLNLTMDVPEGTQLKEAYGDIKITRDAHFSLQARIGRA